MCTLYNHFIQPLGVLDKSAELYFEKAEIPEAMRKELMKEPETLE